MFLLKCLPLVALIAVAFSANPGVKIRLTQKGLEYGRQLGMASLLEKLKTAQIPDFSGKERVSPIGKVQYSLTNIRVVNLGLPQSALNLVPGSGVQLSITNAFISLHGNWRVKYLRVIKDSGSLDVSVNGLSISQTIAIKSDATGKPEASSASCSASVSSAKVKFHGGASWLYNLFSKFIDKALRKALEKQMCPLVAKSIADLNPRLKTLNVLAKVDKYAEIEYSMVSSPEISQPAIDLNLKGEFYNIGRHQEAPVPAPAFSLPAQSSNMIYIALSSYTPNSAGFVYKNAGVLSMYVTDDMIPRSSPIRLSTSTFGFFIPQISQQFPGLMMKMLVKADKNPVVKFQPNTMTVDATATATAYAIQPNGTLSPLFVLNVETSVSGQMSVSDLKLAGRISLDKMKLTLGTSYVGDFKVNSLDNILQVILKLVVIPTVNVQLSKGYPLPALGSMNLVNTQLQIMQDYLLIGTDVQFTG
ncbi:bactericidal permeability-increasing protein [Oryzias melastigma]|uniref:Bactericidal permeability-increasing protein n=1 Tax=Oryzias melastigma TaxID=30732 RepID=A0A3B3CVX4_ORYME|nr:bactericidal permeability-increasing protein [Oryzias melastigma]